MRLIIGGKSQGKLDYVKKTYGVTDADVARSFAEAENRSVLYALHEVVADCMRRGEEPEALIEGLVSDNPGIIIICDEIGAGIIPAEAFEREWRERVGRICCTIAERAESVERILCGLSMRLK